MKPFERILILSDLDNTFLGKHSRLVPENLKAIEEFKALGGKFTFATGRDPYALTRVVPGAADIANYPCIVTNGAYVYDLKKETKNGEIGLNKEKFIPILQKILQNFPEIGVRLSVDGGFISPNMTENLRASLRDFLDITTLLPLEQIPRDLVWHKAVFITDPQKLSHIKHFLATLDLSGFCVCSSCDELFEMLDCNATKGKKVAFLKEISDVPLTVYGVGDYENDLELLAASDIACCPDNSLPEVKKASSIHLCDHDRGAIADLIQRIKNSTGGMIQ